MRLWFPRPIRPEAWYLFSREWRRDRKDGNLYKHTHAKCVYGSQGPYALNFDCVGCLYYSPIQSNRFSLQQWNCIAFLLSGTNLPSNGCSSNSEWVSSLSSCLLIIYLAKIQLSAGSAMLTSDWNSNSEHLRMRPKCPAPWHCELPDEYVVLSN